MPETNFFWDPVEDNIIQERDETGAITAEYATEPYLYGNLISQNRGGVERQYHFDSQGSTLALTDDSQQITDTYAYSAFGEVTERTGSTENPFQYIGQQGYFQDMGTRQYSARRRDLLSLNGRWISMDPLAEDGTNGFLYVSNDPLRSCDPSGFDDIDDRPQNPGDRPGTFDVELRNPGPLYKGCCRTQLIAKYIPSAADKAKYSQIKIIQFAELWQSYYFPCLLGIAKDWHYDPPSGGDFIWCRNRQMDPDCSRTHASYSDFPGGGPNSGKNSDALGCPWPCAHDRIVQVFETCAVGINNPSSIVGSIIGCFSWSVRCTFSYRNAASGYTNRYCLPTITEHWCEVGCTMIRAGGAFALTPHSPEHSTWPVIEYGRND